MAKLSEFIFVNEEFINQFLSQSESLKRRELSKVTRKFKLSLSGPSLESDREYSYVDKPVHVRVDQFISLLKRNNLLLPQRPIEMNIGYHSNSDAPLFCIEKVTATKIIFLGDQLNNLPGVREFSVWVADPDPSQLTEEKWKFRGTFLLLPQTFYDKKPFISVISGCSALQAIMNVYQGNGFFLGPPDCKEALGRGSDLHPVEKLKNAGGIASYPQVITVLYRLRYMTDEQCYTYNNRKYRVNDLLGYPIFIKGH